MLSNETLLKRSDAAFAKKDQWRGVHQTVYRLAIPQRRLPGEEQDSPGRAIDLDCFDSTLLKNVPKFAGRLQADLFPPEERWCKLAPGPLLESAVRIERSDGASQGVIDNRIADAVDKAQRLLASLTRRMFAYIHHSGFDEAFIDAAVDVSVSKLVLQVSVGDKRRPIACSAIPASHVAIDCGPHGAVDGVFRRFKIKPRVIEREWPNADIPDELRKQIDDKPDTDIEIHEVSCFDDDAPESAKPWVYRVLWKGSESREPHMLYEQRSATNPRIVARWFRELGEDEGYGPALIALPDAMTLNQMAKLYLQHIAMVIVGMFVTGEGNLLNLDTFEFAPGAVAEVQDTDAFKHLAWQSRIDVAEFFSERLIRSIDEIMLVDPLPSADPKSTGRSDQELIMRRMEFLRNVGPPVQRLKAELVRPIVRRYLDLMYERNNSGEDNIPEFSELEQLLGIDRFDIDGFLVDADIVTPLAQQQATRELQAFLELDQVLSSYGPEFRMVAERLDALPYKIAHLLGVDLDFLVDSEDLSEKVQGLLKVIEANIGLRLQQAALQTAGAAQQVAGGQA